MLFLPSDKVDFREHQKLHTYLMLARMGCPVFKSVIIENNFLLPSDIDDIALYLKSDFCTVRYQYIHPNSHPVRGGNKIRLQYDTLIDRLIPDAFLWLLEPIDRLKNNYGVNMYFCRSKETLIIECVGKGFDVSDLNRGDVSPHQIISFQLPIEYGWYNEWWKYANFQFVSNHDYEISKILRLKKLANLGFNVDENIFNKQYKPLTVSLVEILMKYSELVYCSLTHENDFVVSCSIDDKNKIVFWDIQTPIGKAKILRGS
jgi:hypothetical protein